MIAADKPFVTIDMVSDIVCPWCYIGFRGLDWAAMALSFEYTVVRRYRPYRLDPETPKGGSDRAATLARKVPDPEVRAAMQSQLVTSMRDVGLDFSPETPKLLVDTTDAHRVIRWAAEEEEPADHAAKAALFEAYWRHGEDVSQLDALGQVVESIGLDADLYVERLRTGEDRDAVAQEAAELRGGGVAGVPAFIVNEQAGFEGALPKAEMTNALKTLIAETAAVEGKG